MGPGRPADSIPGPDPTPLLGGRVQTLRFFSDPIAYLERLKRTYGSVVRLTGGTGSLVLFQPVGEKAMTVCGFGSEINREVLTQPEVFGGGQMKTPPGLEWINENMIAAPEEDRVLRRSMLSPAFTRQHLEHFYVKMVAEIERMVHRWQGLDSIDLSQEMYDFSSIVASSCLYGQASEAHGDHIAPLVRRFAALLFHPLSSIPINLPGTPYRRFRRLGQAVREELLRELARRRDIDSEQPDVLGVLLAQQEEKSRWLTEDEFLGDTVALFLAGHDVPANAAIFSLLLLTQHPEVLAALMEELDRELAGEPPTYAQIWQLPVLDQVYKECLRLLGPALLIFRQTIADGILGGYELPRGTEVFLSPYLTHLDPEIYAAPKKFDPTRWSDTKPSAFEYFPYSYGARRCLGMSLAELELKLLLTMVLQRFRLTPEPRFEPKFLCNFVIHPKGAWRFGLGPRDGRYAESKVELRGRIRSMVDFD